MKKISLMLALNLVAYFSYGFCGFYVAKADATLFNESSQVIIARDGSRSTITMANDYKGDMKEFAMIVPVPVVLNDDDIKVVSNSLFTTFDSYSAPRLAKYHDQDPCYQPQIMYEINASMTPRSEMMKNKKLSVDMEDEYKVTIEAQYEKGEYDILILSAEDSGGLEKWLIKEGYKIPAKANEALGPYIKDKMKFFVVKVNLDRMKLSGASYLNPLQISFDSERFMLPIRLGMANSKGTQDMIVYVLSQNGRVETSNYQTKKMPTNQQVPLFIKDHFGDFYKSTFSKKYTNNKSSVFTEYSWDISSYNYVKCDPCNSTPPSGKDLITAGASWLTFTQPRWGGANYDGNIHFTRLHVRYDREHFPQDLQFTETKDKQTFQCRYVLNIPAETQGNCPEALTYFKTVQTRRENEIHNLEQLTWWDMDRYQAYLEKYQKLINEKEGILKDDADIKEEGAPLIPFNIDFPNGGKMLLIIMAIGAIATLAIYFRKWQLA